MPQVAILEAYKKEYNQNEHFLEFQAQSKQNKYIKGESILAKKYKESIVQKQ